MKTIADSIAVLISGQMRTFDKCLASLDWFLYRQIPNPWFYISCAADEQSDFANLLRRRHPNVYIEEVEQPYIQEPVSVMELQPMNISVPVQSVLRQLWHLRQVWSFAKAHGHSHRAYVRSRPDSLFHRFESPLDDWNIPAKKAFTPCWSSYGGINDRFAILGVEAAEAYFLTYDRMAGLLAKGCPLHPETLIHESLRKDEIVISQSLIAEFSTLRLNGDRVWPAVYPSDYFHYIKSIVHDALGARLPGTTSRTS